MSSRGEEEEVGCMENNKNRPRPWVRAIQSHSTSRHTPVNTPLERLTSTIASTSSPATRKFQTTPSRKKSVPEKQFKCHLSEETVSPVHIMVKLQVSFSQLFFLHLLYLRPLFPLPPPAYLVSHQKSLHKSTTFYERDFNLYEVSTWSYFIFR